MAWGIDGQKTSGKPVFGLRFQLLTLALFLLIVPWLGYQYIEGVERHLLSAREDALRITSRIAARALENEPALFDRVAAANNDQPGRDLYAYELDTAPRLDGRDDEWKDLMQHAMFYGKDHIIEIQRAYSEDSLNFRRVTGYYGDALYTFFRVIDDSVVYREVNSISVHRNDNLQIVLGAEDDIRRYTIATVQPGPATTFLVASREQGSRALAAEPRIEAFWLAAEYGYNLEVKIPLSMVPGNLGFAFADVDNPETRVLIAAIGTSDILQRDGTGNLVIPSSGIEARLRQWGDLGSVIRILDRHHRVIARAGDFTGVAGIRDDSARVDSEQITSAFTGTPASGWRTTSKARIVSAAHPIQIGGENNFVLLAEQTTSDILELRGRAMERLFTASLLILLVGGLLLYLAGFAISWRVRRLRKQIAGSVDVQGRVRQLLPGSKVNDEIGDLARDFAGIIGRLKQYNTYLEDMSRRLAHELRTPVTVVRSSLDNLSMEKLDDDARIYLERANEGVHRLATILNSMTEATRLEQSLDDTEQEIFDLAEVIRGCVQGYELAYAPTEFQLSIEAEPVKIDGNPDLIAQMLDKLISNAVEFSSQNAPVKIRLTVEDDAVIRVINDGPALPEDMQDRLFDSMVSVRQTDTGEGSHLGLGLYIVRIIAEFHGGSVTAHNREDAEGVIVTVRLPIMRLTGRR